MNRFVFRVGWISMFILRVGWINRFSKFMETNDVGGLATADLNYLSFGLPFYKSSHLSFGLPLYKSSHKCHE